jgi:hypothetical protein
VAARTRVPGVGTRRTDDALVADLELAGSLLA